MRRTASIAMACALGCVFGQVARAAPARDLVTAPIASGTVALARGELEMQLVLETSLRPAFLGRPLSLSPDVWFGVTSRLTVGLVHSNQSVDQIDTGDSFCVRSRALDCDRIYQGSGLDARYALRDGALAVAPRVRWLVRDVDPVKPAVTAGALIRWTRGRFAIASDPYLQIGLANRDRGNRAALVVPIWLSVQPTCRWLVALHTGYDAEVKNARDGFHVPVALGVGVSPISRLQLAVELGFPSLLGPQNQLQERVLQVSIGWRERLR